MKHGKKLKIENQVLIFFLEYKDIWLQPTKPKASTAGDIQIQDRPVTLPSLKYLYPQPPPPPTPPHMWLECPS